MRISKITSTAVTALATAALLVGCSSAPATVGSTADPAAVAEGKAIAEAAIAPYLGQPSEFPDLEPLAELPAGATVAFADQGTPFSAVVYDLLQGAAEVMGVSLIRFDAGHAADTISAAFSAIVASKPDAVITAGINIELWKNQFAELEDAGIPIVTAGVTGTAEYGIPGPQAAEAFADLTGSLVADYITARLGTDSQVVVYTVPELSFTGGTATVIEAELAEVCPGCKVRVVEIPIATVGNTAPSTIVRDLQSHPESTVGVFPNDEVSTGLAAALSAAGLDLKLVGMSPGPAELQSIANGDQAVGLASDTPVFAWGLLDQAARLMAGQELTGAQAAGLTIQLQFLEPEDITFDPSHGWSGSPDFAARYAEIWGVKG